MVESRTGGPVPEDAADLSPGDAANGEQVGGARRPPRLGIWLAVGLVVAVAVFALFWFQPHKLFVDDRVDEGVPEARGTTTATATSDAGDPDARAGAAPEATPPTSAPPPPSDEPVDLATGSFVSLDHSATGTVRVLLLADGRRFVRFEGFETENGPDLYVYLTANPAGGPEQAFDDDYVDLGRLQGNVGDQNYELTPDVDLSAYTSVVVWCDRFDSAFGAANLTMVPA